MQTRERSTNNGTSKTDGRSKFKLASSIKNIQGLKIEALLSTSTLTPSSSSSSSPTAGEELRMNDGNSLPSYQTTLKLLPIEANTR